ncbi:dihydroorotate dehydrogenase [Bacillus spongiae]|uniref:Dihydroorotate dehydrogenase n=1 Tax=Bacillus spongiae TaxID=2683610 RepID=A0ABU8H8B4_9BACI
MPDWSYHVLFQPILTKLSPYSSREFIHRRMNTIASLPFGSQIIHFLGREECSPKLRQDLGGIEFKNPVGLSGKIDPLLSGTKAFSNLGFGFLELGPITLKPRVDAQLPTINREKHLISFPAKPESIGIDATIQTIMKVKKKQPLLLKLSGTIDEISTMMDQLDPYADEYIVEAIDATFASQSSKPIYLTLSCEKVKNLTEIPHYFSGIVLNTTHNEGDQLIRNIHQLRSIGFSKSIITSGAIEEPEQALGLLDSGADLVMLSDGYVFSGPGLTKRINEALLDRMEQPLFKQEGWLAYWLFGLFILLGGILAFLFSLTTIILPYDEAFLKMKKEAIWKFNNRVMLFMAHDRMTLAGTMISGGIVYMTLAKYGIKEGLKWAKQATDTAAIVGFLGIFLFIGYGYFDWLHLLFWLVLLPFFLYGFYKTKGITGTPTSPNRKNHTIWRRALYGQFFFVVLGFSFVIGGIVISLYGVTAIFVPTDLLYICMSPEQLQSFNERLIPVIAHDRAGFGSALLSVGLLVLMLALWGFQQGKKWVWWTFFIGGLPAFFTAIYIHFAIGYTSFIHLLPAYFALALFFSGLLASYSFFHKNRDE